MIRCLACAAIWSAFFALTVYCIAVDDPTGIPAIDAYARTVAVCYWLFGTVLAGVRLAKLFSMPMLEAEIDSRHVHDPRSVLR